MSVHVGETCLHVVLCAMWQHLPYTVPHSHYSVRLQGLKTGMYYLRTRPAANAIQFTVDQKVVQKVREDVQKSQDASKQETNEQQEKAMACSIQNKEDCLMCSS